MNKIEAYKSSAVVYHKCLIYRMLCHWLHDQKIYSRYIAHVSYIFYILKTSHGFVNQYYNLDIEVEMGAMHPSVFVIYCARFYFTSARDFSVFILSGFFIMRSPKNSRTKFEVKRHFTIRAGGIAGTQRIKFVFFPYQYLQNFSISDQNPGVAAYRR